MAFYAKGSPGSFLHLTQTADARGGITDDTIFHSSMPYVMFEGMWETTLTNLPASATTRGQKRPYVDKDLYNYLPEMRVGNIPAGAVAALNDPTAVVLTEIEFVVGGVTRTKVLSGVTIDVGRHNINGEGYYSDWRVYITPRQGLDAHIGYYSGGITGDPRSLIKNSSSFGLETYVMRGVSNDGNGSGAFGAYDIGYNLSGKRDFRPKTGHIATSLQGKGYNTVGILPHCRFASPDMEPLPNSAKQTFETFSETWKRPPSVSGRIEWGYEGGRIPLACTPDNKWVWGGNANGANDTYGEISKFVGVTFTKVRWYKLNLAFNIGTGFSIRSMVPATGEVKISGSEFIVNGKRLNGLTSGIMYQVDKKSRPNLRLLTAGTSYPNGNLTTERAVFPMMGIDSNGGWGSPAVDSRSTLIPTTGTQNSYIAVINPTQSSKWFCTNNTIGDQHGVIWGAGGFKALQLIPGRAAKAVVSSTINKITPSSNVPVRVGKVGLGLPTSGSSTVVIAITSSDYKVVLPGDSYFCSSWNSYGKYPNGQEVFGDPKYFMLPSDNNWPEKKIGDHSVLTLPVGRFVPIMLHRMSNCETLWWSTPSSEGVHQTSIFWLKNAGDGTVEVYLTQRQDKKYEYMNVGVGPASFTQLFHSPAINIYIHRLT